MNTSNLCSTDPSAYANPAERLLMAIGEPEMIDTRHDPVLSRIFSNKVIPRYPVFNEFFGMEEPIEQIVGFLKHAAQGLEETKQVLYLLGPVGGGKSSLAEKLKDLMEKTPFYAIKGSPVFDSPLSLFRPRRRWFVITRAFFNPYPSLTVCDVTLGCQTVTRIQW